MVADDLGCAEGAPRPVDVVTGLGLRRIRREDRQVVGEHVHAPVVGIRPVQAAAEGCQGVVLGHGRLLGGHDLTDPGSGIPVRGEEDPLAAKRVPAQLPGHGPPVPGSGAGIDRDLLWLAPFGRGAAG